MSLVFDKHTMSLELWIDEPKTKVLNEGYFRELHDQGIDGIAIMIDECDRMWKSLWRLRDLDHVFRLSDKYAIEVILTIWPYPSKTWMQSAFRDLQVMCDLGPLSAIEADLEFNWRTKHVEGYTARDGMSRLEQAGEEYVARLSALTDEYQIRKEMTTFTSHMENGRAATVSPYMDCIVVQAYATRHRPGLRGNRVAIPWDHAYGPGHMQKYTFDRTMLVPGVIEREVEVGYGHALWDQKWIGHTPVEAMSKSMDAALSHPIGITRVRCWSSKWRARNTYASRYLLSLQEDGNGAE